MHSKKGFLPFLIGSIALISLLAFPKKQEGVSSKTDLDFEQFKKAQSQSLNEQLDDLIALESEDLSYSTIRSNEKFFSEKGLSLFIVEEDDLIYWSEDQSTLTIEELRADSEFASTTTTLFFKKGKKSNEKEYYALRKIAINYPYQNSYLQSELAEEWKPYLSFIEGGLPWQNHSMSDQHIDLTSLLYSSILLLLGLVLVVYSIPYLFVKNRLMQYLSWILLIILARFYLLLFDPLDWFSLGLFDPVFFNYGKLAPSTADLFLNSLGFLLVTYLLIELIREYEHLLIKAISFSVFLIANTYIFQLIHSSVLNSQYSFELENLFKLSWSSYIVIVSFGVLYLSSFLWLRNSIGQKNVLKQLLLFSLLILAHSIIIQDMDETFLEAFVAFLLLGILWLSTSKSKLPDLLFILLILMVFSSLTAYRIDQSLEEREYSSRRVLLQKLAEERDPLLEYLFTNIQEDIREDDSLMAYLDERWDQKKGYENYLRDNYLNGYWDRYRINITLCAQEDSILIGTNRTGQACFEYFQNRIYQEGDQISSINLFQLSNLAGRIDYIGEIQLGGSSNYKLYMELSRDYFSEDLGYPELFLNEEDKQLRSKLDEYSYAVYFKNELISSEGEFVYKTSNKVEDTLDFAFHSYETAEFSHTQLQKNENISIVLSKKKTKFFDYLSRVTYLLVIYGMIFLLLLIILPNFPFHHPFILSDFSTKLRLLITSTLLLALILFLSGTTYYIKEQYEAKNARAIEDKLRSISLELDQKIGSYDSLETSINPYVTSILIKFSNVFYTDINLYDANGGLYSSSRPELFDQSLKSRRMNPLAYASMVRDDRSKWVQQESIGKLGYLSAYVPFKNRQNELLAYLNLPYFARQEELQEEISAFLAPTINSYVIIFTLALLISFLLMNQISKPLLLIRKHISRLKLGSSTDLIEWQSDDEIGELVKEYNRIAIELGQSAAELAKNEREVAWREMAKQIAHEIKNPLTPMKLSIQHLQRSSEDERPEIQEKIKKTSDTLISQIESLTSIAEAFSSFTKFPEKELQEVDLLEVINDLVHLYVDQANFEIRSDLNKNEHLALADKDLVLRIFNNLIKNAIQAHDKEGLAQIVIHLGKDPEDEGSIRIEISDLGKGISNEQAKKIFDPSFTTKSSGTGLGLAIVKRSLEQIGGKIEMKSELGVGTTFTLYFPIA